MPCRHSVARICAPSEHCVTRFRVQNGEKFSFLRFWLRIPFGHKSLGQKKFVFAFFLLVFILLLLQGTVRTWGSVIAIHSYIGIQMWITRTLGLQPIAQINPSSDVSGLVPHSSFCESKRRCRMGHEVRKRQATTSGAHSPAILAFLKKGGQRAERKFCGAHFCVWHGAKN